MFIKPTANAKSLWDVSEEVAMEFLLYPKNDCALPWDADIMVEGDKVTIIGSIGGGSSNEYTRAGYCRCECSVNNFTDFYQMELPDRVADPSTLELLKEAGWIEA